MISSTKSPYEVVLRPLITEKTVASGAHNKYFFEVSRAANKYEIAEAIEQIQADIKNTVTVVSVNTMIVKGKTRQGRFFKRSNRGRTSDWKKAIVTIAPGQQIEVVEGV
jgi:large subunit ribosomal protein L23